MLNSKSASGLSPNCVPESRNPRTVEIKRAIELEGLRCRIHGEERTRPWADMNIRLRHGRHPTRLLQILGELGIGKRLTQSRRDVNDRKAISDVRKFLKSYVMPLSDDPFREFEDGWGIKFTVSDKIGRSQVKTIADDELADSSDENSPFTYQDDIDPVEMAGFSIRQI